MGDARNLTELVFRLPPVPRRRFLGLVVAGLAAACADDGADDAAGPTSVPDPTEPPATTVASTTTTTTTTIPVPDLSGDPFTLGVASGDPLPDAVVVWTRLALDPADPASMPDVDVPIGWEVATGDDFADVVASGVAVATPAHAHSVHVDVTGLDPATRYHYRFSVGGHRSPVGRTRTAPAEGSLAGARFAVANCQAYQSGYYPAHRHLAAEDLDAVLFVGDYIYELENPPAIREHGIADLPYDLDGYRRFYGVYRADADLQAAHGAHPWIVTWDDHEVEDNYADRLPGRIGTLLRPDAAEQFPERRAAAYQAWWEHMPVRTPPPVDGDLRIHRSFRYGDLVELAVLDDRQYRSPLIDVGDGALPRPFGGGPQPPEAFDESRTMLGAEQEAWLADLLSTTPAQWKLVVQQTIMAEIDRRPDDPDAGFSMDAWDGYPAARRRLLGHIADEAIADVVVVGGDIHTAAVTELKVDYADPAAPTVAIELVGPSISSTENLGPEALAGSRSHDHVHLYDPDHRGYLVVDLTPSRVQADFRYVTSALEPDADIETASSWVIDAGVAAVRQR